MSNKEYQDLDRIEKAKLTLEAILMQKVTKFLEQKTKDGMSEGDKVSTVVSAFVELTATWAKFIAKIEAKQMFEEGTTSNYEAEQSILVLLAEYGDRQGLDFGRFLTLTKDDEGVWHSPVENNN